MNSLGCYGYLLTMFVRLLIRLVDKHLDIVSARGLTPVFVPKGHIDPEGQVGC